MAAQTQSNGVRKGQSNPYAIDKCVETTQTENGRGSLRSIIKRNSAGPWISSATAPLLAQRWKLQRAIDRLLWIYRWGDRCTCITSRKDEDEYLHHDQGLSFEEGSAQTE